MILVARSGHQEKKLVWSPALGNGLHSIGNLETCQRIAKYFVNSKTYAASKQDGHGKHKECLFSEIF